MANYNIGFDLGGTKMLAGLVDSELRVVETVKRKSKSEAGAEAVFQDIAGTLQELLEKSGKNPEEIGAIGLSVPGILDRKKGVVVRTPNLGFSDFPLVARLKEHLPVPVILENDVNAGVWGEYVAGAARGYRHVLGVFPGTGIGGGLIINGDLYLGAGGNAGEIGHMVIQWDGALCGCGQRGHIEALASRGAMAKEAAGLVANGTLTGEYAQLGADIKAFSSKIFAQGIKEDNPAITGIVDRAAELLGVHIGGCLNLLNPELVLIGGGLIEKLGDYYLKRIEKAMRSSAWNFVAQDAHIKAGTLGDHAGIIGAADLAHRASEKKGKSTV
ncbi:MAG: ROK family protein [Spirochaetales bacterium]|nr:ROK family protein [Spirochaetales bacterium]